MCPVGSAQSDEGILCKHLAISFIRKISATWFDVSIDRFTLSSHDSEIMILVVCTIIDTACFSIMYRKVEQLVYQQNEAETRFVGGLKFNIFNKLSLY